MRRATALIGATVFHSRLYLTEANCIFIFPETQKDDRQRKGRKEVQGIQVLKLDFGAILSIPKTTCLVYFIVLI